jgi:hypothetical protein
MVEIAQLSTQIVSAIMCFVLVRFMIKPYGLTREGRYLGLPLGFGFLGFSEIFLTVGILLTIEQLRFISLLTRTFAYVFLAAAYYFSKEPSKNSRLIWDIAFSSIVVALTTFALLFLERSELGFTLPTNLGIALRVLALICISYISLHTLRSHVRSPDPSTLWIPLGFILLGISQYSLIIWAAEESPAIGYAFAGGIITRLMGLSVFLAVSYFSFYKKSDLNEKNSA